MTFKENIVMRLIGLFIFFAPGHGVVFMTDVFEGVEERIAEKRRAA